MTYIFEQISCPWMRLVARIERRIIVSYKTTFKYIFYYITRVSVGRRPFIMYELANSLPSLLARFNLSITMKHF